MEACREASVETGGNISVRTLRADISSWTESASWGDQFRAALALWAKGGQGTPILSKDWYPDFYAAMQEAQGIIADACELAGVGPDLVYALRDKRNKCYDKDFDEQVRILEGLRFSRIRENVLKQAEVATADGAKLGQKALESAMPSLHAPQHKVEIEAHMEVEHKGLPDFVVAASAARVKALLAHREARELPAAAEREVIDVTPREMVKEEVR